MMRGGRWRPDPERRAPPPRSDQLPVEVAYQEICQRKERAIHIRFNDGLRIWVAKSQIHQVNEQRRVLVLARWLAEKHKLIPGGA